MTAPMGALAPRSLLFVPALQATSLLAKVPRWRPDVVVVDLEDAVPPDRKEEAREVLVEAVRSTPVAPTLTFVRLNAQASRWHERDVDAAVRSGASGVVLPKYDAVEQYDALRQRLDAAGAASLVIIVGLETVLGVADARALLARGPYAAYFGAEDYVSDLGGSRSDANLEVLYARSQVAVAGRLAGCPVIDQAVVSVRDQDRFQREATEGRRLGYCGKICIHPGQVALAHAAFSSSSVEIARAEAVLAAAADGVAIVEGDMVDEVHRRMARQVLKLARHAGHEGEDQS